jgi:hypothetical protein
MATLVRADGPWSSSAHTVFPVAMQITADERSGYSTDCPVVLLGQDRNLWPFSDRRRHVHRASGIDCGRRCFHRHRQLLRYCPLRDHHLWQPRNLAHRSESCGGRPIQVDRDRGWRLDRRWIDHPGWRSHREALGDRRGQCGGSRYSTEFCSSWLPVSSNTTHLRRTQSITNQLPRGAGTPSRSGFPPCSAQRGGSQTGRPGPGLSRPIASRRWNERCKSPVLHHKSFRHLREVTCAAALSIDVDRYNKLR